MYANFFNVLNWAYILMKGAMAQHTGWICYEFCTELYIFLQLHHQDYEHTKPAEDVWHSAGAVQKNHKIGKPKRKSVNILIFKVYVSTLEQCTGLLSLLFISEQNLDYRTCKSEFEYILPLFLGLLTCKG